MPGLVLAYVVPVLTLILGQGMAIAWGAARGSGRQARSRPTQWSLRFARGRDFLHDIYGPAMPKRLVVIFQTLFVMAWLTALVCMLVSGAFTAKEAATHPCQYTSNDHGTVVCVSALQAAAEQGIFPAGFLGFNVLQAGSAIGGVLEQRSHNRYRNIGLAPYDATLACRHRTNDRLS